MKKHNIFTWIFKCFGPTSGEVSYKIRYLLTFREAKSFAKELIESNPELRVNLYKRVEMD